MPFPPLIDCHAHLCDPVFDEDRREVLDLDLAPELERWIREHRVDLVAIGEVGLDHWKVEEPEGRDFQQEIFRRFIRPAATPSRICWNRMQGESNSTHSTASLRVPSPRSKPASFSPFPLRSFAPGRSKSS